MQNRLKPPALNDNMSQEELAKRFEEMMATNSDMDTVDESVPHNHENQTLSHIAG